VILCKLPSPLLSSLTMIGGFLLIGRSNAVVTLNFHWDEVQFKEEVAKHIAKHARKTRAEWKKEILGE